MFFTGDAGTGKSYVLRLIVSALKKKFGSQKVFVTASTGPCRLQHQRDDAPLVRGNR